MDLQGRLNALIVAIGADISRLNTAVNTASAKVVIRPTYSFPGSASLFTGTLRWYNDSGRTLTISSVRASVGTAPTGTSLIADVRKNGTSIWATTTANKPTIAVSTNTILRTTFDTTTVLNGDYLTVDVTQIGSTVPGSDLTVQINLS